VYEVVALATGKQQSSVVLAIGTPGPELENTVLVGGLPAGGPFWGENRVWSPADVVALWSPCEAVS
jgi:hypothetical protein